MSWFPTLKHLDEMVVEWVRAAPNQPESGRVYAAEALARRGGVPLSDKKPFATVLRIASDTPGWTRGWMPQRDVGEWRIQWFRNGANLAADEFRGWCRSPDSLEFLECWKPDPDQDRIVPVSFVTYPLRIRRFDEMVGAEIQERAVLDVELACSRVYESKPGDRYEQIGNFERFDPSLLQLDSVNADME